MLKHWFTDSFRNSFPRSLMQTDIQHTNSGVSHARQPAWLKDLRFGVLLRGRLGPGRPATPTDNLLYLQSTCTTPLGRGCSLFMAMASIACTVHRIELYTRYKTKETEHYIWHITLRLSRHSPNSCQIILYSRLPHVSSFPPSLPSNYSKATLDRT